LDHDGISKSEGGSSGAEESYIPLIQVLRFDVLKVARCVGDHGSISNSEGDSSGAEESYAPLIKAITWILLNLKAVRVAPRAGLESTAGYPSSSPHYRLGSGRSIFLFFFDL